MYSDKRPRHINTFCTKLDDISKIFVCITINTLHNRIKKSLSFNSVAFKEKGEGRGQILDATNITWHHFSSGTPGSRLLLTKSYKITAPYTSRVNYAATFQTDTHSSIFQYPRRRKGTLATKIVGLSKAPIEEEKIQSLFLFNSGGKIGFYTPAWSLSI